MFFLWLTPQICLDSDAPAGHDRLFVNKDNASTGGLQAGPQRISVF